MARLLFCLTLGVVLCLAVSVTRTGGSAAVDSDQSAALIANKRLVGGLVFGLRSGRGTCIFWRRDPRRFPIFLAAGIILIRIFRGPRCRTRFGPRLTVLKALENESPDGFSSLARHGVASLLNSYTVQNFAYTPEQVMNRFESALVSEESAAALASEFENANALV